MPLIICKNIILRLVAILALSPFEFLMADTATVTNAVYIIQNPDGPNHIAAYIQDPNTGNLSLLGQYGTGGRGSTLVHGDTSHALVSDGTHLFTVNSGDNTITVFNILRNGALNSLGTFNSQGHRPVSLAIHKNVLYVLNQGSKEANIEGLLTAFKIESNGTLTVIQTSYAFPPKSLPVDVLTSPRDGLISVSLHDAMKLEIFRMTPAGIELASTARMGLPPYGGVTLPPSNPVIARSPILGDLFFVTLDSEKQPGVATIRSSATGKKNKIQKSTRHVLKDPCWAAVNPQGNRIWVSSFEKRILSLYTLGRTGAYRWVSDNVDIAEGPGGLDVSTSGDGAYVFRLRGFATASPFDNVQPYVDVFVANAGLSNAGLQLLSTQKLPTDWSQSAPMGIIAIPIAP